MNWPKEPYIFMIYIFYTFDLYLLTPNAARDGGVCLERGAASERVARGGPVLVGLEARVAQRPPRGLVARRGGLGQLRGRRVSLEIRETLFWRTRTRSREGETERFVSRHVCATPRHGGSCFSCECVLEPLFSSRGGRRRARAADCDAAWRVLVRHVPHRWREVSCHGRAAAQLRRTPRAAASSPKLAAARARLALPLPCWASLL